MRNMKKGMAVVLAATMTLGSTFTVLASDGTSKTGTISGSGTSEGHVEKEVQNMILPTVEAGSSPFAYIMDPERLIQETEGAKYDDFTFPAAASDKGVYFLTGDKVYENTSNTLQAINKSSCDVTLTVKVKSTQNTANDITLVDTPSTSTTAAELYLGLKVGTTTQAVSGTEETVTKTIAGMPTNFETIVKDNGSGQKVYAYQEKPDATTWKAINISMTGEVNEFAIDEDTSAPTVDVTWSWAKAADDATADTDVVDYVTTPATSSAAAIVVPDDGNATAAITIGSDGAVPTSLTTDAYSGNMFAITNGWGATYDAENNTIVFESGVSGDLRSGKAQTFTVTFTPETGEAYTQSLVLAN